MSEHVPLLSGRRIVLVLAGEVLGGAERSALELARDLRGNEGAEVAILALDDRPGRARAFAAEYAIPWSSVRTPWLGSQARKAASLGRVARALRRLHPDALVSFTNLPNVVSGLTWRLTGASVSIWNQCDVNGTVRISQRIFRRALQATPVIVTSAYHGRDWLIETFGADRRRINVVRQTLELAPARESGEAWRTRLGLGQDDFVACMLAHLHAGKDHATLLRAWRLVVDQLSAERQRAVVVLAGRDAGGADAAKALAFDLDLRDHVRFAGEVADVTGLLEAADIGVLSSRRELFGRGAIEPMAAGLAVAGTDVPGIREVFGELGASYLAPPGDAARLADVMIRLALDPDARVRVGRASAELVRARHSVEATSHLYATLLADALASSRASPEPR